MSPTAYSPEFWIGIVIITVAVVAIFLVCSRMNQDSDPD